MTDRLSPERENEIDHYLGMWSDGYPWSVAHELRRELDAVRAERDAFQKLISSGEALEAIVRTWMEGLTDEEADKILLSVGNIFDSLNHHDFTKIASWGYVRAALLATLNPEGDKTG